MGKAQVPQLFVFFDKSHSLQHLASELRVELPAAVITKNTTMALKPGPLCFNIFALHTQKL